MPLFITMVHLLGSLIVRHAFNGNVEDAPKFVEMDGKNFMPDPSDPTKAKKDEGGKPIPFIEQAPLPKLEDLAKTHPDIAKLLEERDQLTKKEQERLAEERKRHEEDSAKKGEFQKLFDESKKREEELAKELETTRKQLGKYAESTKEILESVIKTIPEKNLQLIPADYSPREKLAYITKNAELLGAQVMSPKGAPVPKNDNPAPITDESKLVGEIAELEKKAREKGLSAFEQTQMYEKAKALKVLRQTKK